MFSQMQLVPKDIPLPLPLPEWLLITLLVLSFLLHILFVNLMLGGSILTLWFERQGLKDKRYDSLAYQVAQTITVNKSLAVVLGVAPLLSINVLYTIYFYSANALTGKYWIMLVPLVAFVFLLLYAHKYTWKILEDNKPLHIAIISVAVGCFLFIPFVFLTNINLMLFPEKWGEVSGFFSALSLPNVLPRYFHFVVASLAITGLFLFYYISRKSFEFEEELPGFTKYELQKKFYSLGFGATVSQFLFGSVVFITLPSKGVDWDMFWFIATGVSFAIVAMVLMWKEITGPVEKIGRYFYYVVGILTVTVIFMGTGRHVYRANALEPHQKLMAERTARHIEMVQQAALEAEMGLEAEKDLPPGEKLFKQYCSVCHKLEDRLVGPPVTEMIEVYKDDFEGFKKWVRVPGRKRMEYPAMTGFPQLTDEELKDLGDYIFEQ
ncbi:c-type cytochrome [Plebeiibacterium marinum]|uniref:C-type cytochrome n=1 Tax=Plebeiibacterium marinum TaxID=2992111 RepID=A0AAE3MHW9_9BACT|nr:c-type cytochrome [Plebeiobacterium marinum]MCW3807781.1 c-type cytochrome [Plebeiobacterium marinum]